jgi:hypothetical protein
MTLDHSWADPKLWSNASSISPYWLYAATDYIFLPDFSSQVNAAERYARPFSLPVFNKYLLLAADDMEKAYRAIEAPHWLPLPQNAMAHIAKC